MENGKAKAAVANTDERNILRRANRTKGTLNQLTVTRISDSFKELNCRVRFADQKNFKIRKTNQFYFEILTHWDKKNINYHKGYRVLVLSKNDQLLFELAFDPEEVLLNEKHLELLLKQLKKYDETSKIFFGQNNPTKEVLPSDTETNMAKHFKELGERLKVKIVDQIIMSKTECYSFEENWAH